MKFNEMINSIIEGSISLENALQRTRIYALKTGNTDLKRWIDLEINGYESDDELPSYRKSRSGVLKYSGINGSYKVTDIPFPMNLLDEEIKATIRSNVVIYGIGIIEEIVEKNSDMCIEMSALAGVIFERSQGEIKCISITKYVPNTIFQRVCSEVKSILIDKLVEIQKNQGDEDSNEVERNICEKQIDYNRKVFIIHGHHELLRRELYDLLEKEFNLEPIVLVDQPADGITPFLDKFEKYAKQCCFAFALFTPDDVVTKDNVQYFQVRPNVIFELGWFISYFNRKRVCILNQAGCGTEIFSDLHGIERLEFQYKVEEIFVKIRNELRTAGIVD